MTTPDVPHRITFSVEVPGTPDQVWAALATTDGLSSWFLPTDVDEHEGGAIVVHMGETDSPGTVTGWDPPRRLAYEEPEWAAAAGQPDAQVSPLVSEFLVEARSGGTCVVRVVSSAFGTGAEWESEVIQGMTEFWLPYFEHHLRMYLGRFPGQRATTLSVHAAVPAPGGAVQEAIKRDLGATEVGRVVDLLGPEGRVERAGDPYVVVSLTDPVPGYMSFFAMDNGDGSARVQVAGWFFGDGAPAFVETATPAWRSWADGLVVPDAPTSVRR